MYLNITTRRFARLVFAVILTFFLLNTGRVSSGAVAFATDYNGSPSVSDDMHSENLSSSPPYSGTLNLSESSVSYLQAKDGSLFNLNPNGTTIEFWVELPPGFEGRAQIIEKPGAYDIAIYKHESNEFIYVTSRGKANPAWLSSASQGWHHIVLEYAWNSDTKQEDFRLYADESNLFGSSSGPETPPTSDLPLRVSQSEHIAIDELRITDALVYPSGVIEVPTDAFVCDNDTVALWHFDEEASSDYTSSCEPLYELVPTWEVYLPLISS